MLNKIILIGRLTKDPELKYTPSGVAVANFTLAVDRTFTNQQEKRDADFIPIIVWRKQAENCAKYLTKGRLVAVEGRLQVRTYDTQGGQRRWVTEVVAENIQFMPDGKNINTYENTTNDSNDSTDSFSFSFGDNEIKFNNDDIPF